MSSKIVSFGKFKCDIKMYLNHCAAVRFTKYLKNGQEVCQFILFFSSFLFQFSTLVLLGGMSG